MSKRGDPDPSATVVLAKRVRAGMEADFEAWQAGINAAARAHAGFEAAEVVRPVPGVQDEYVVIYRFDGAETLREWMVSDERSEWIARGKPMLEAAPVQHRIATPKSNTVTVVVTHRVKPGAERAYQTWQHNIVTAVSHFDGFVSTEQFEPNDEQPDWVVVFRFDSAKHLEGWIESDERARWLAEAVPLLKSWDLHRISGGLGGWFEVSRDDQTVRTAPPWKQALVVLLTLYPTVMTVRLVVGPLLTDLSGAVQVLIGNILGVAMLTWLLMPAATRAMRWWLKPQASQRTTALGAVGVVGLIATMTALFWALEVHAG